MFSDLRLPQEPTVVLRDLPAEGAPREAILEEARSDLSAELSHCMDCGLFTDFRLAGELFGDFDPNRHRAWENELGAIEQRAQNYRILGRILTPNYSPAEWYEKLQAAVHEIDLERQTAMVLALCHEAFDGPGPDIGNELFAPPPAHVQEALRDARDFMDSPLDTLAKNPHAFPPPPIRLKIKE
jgi:hypothetical protein